MLSETTIDLPIEALSLFASDKGLSAVLFEEHRMGKVKLPDERKHDPNHPILVKAAQQLKEYFLGERMEFDLPLDPWGGTFFQKSVWESLCKIPYGSVVSYSYQSHVMLGMKNAVRAVAAANSKIPFPSSFLVIEWSPRVEGCKVMRGDSK